MFSYQAFQIFLFLIPGLLATIIVNALIVRKEQGAMNTIIEIPLQRLKSKANIHQEIVVIQNGIRRMSIDQ